MFFPFRKMTDYLIEKYKINKILIKIFYTQ